jgi:predicted transcriptional regulator
MHKYLQPREIEILKTLDEEQEPIGYIDLSVKLHYWNSDKVRICLQRLENVGLICKRRPYQRKAILLTDEGRAAAAALAAKEAA